MSALIPLVLLAILLVPIIVIASLVSLRGKVRDLTAQVDWLSHRVSALQAKLNQLPGHDAPASPGTLPTSELVGQAERPFIPEAPIRPSSPPRPAAVPPPLPPVLTPEPPVLEPMPPLVSAPAFAASAAGPTPEPALSDSDNSCRELPASSPTRPAASAINWEQFMGVKLFAWIGGFALFLAVAFFIKYSFDRNLISPELRVTVGFLTGLGLLAGGVVMKRRELAVTSQTLCATGVVILYAVTFACHSIYHFPLFGPWLTFLVMVLITATAFTLAVQLEAMVVAILGLLGGFLTPVLLSTGEDNSLALFSYIALLDLGLIAVAFRRRWQFLILLGALGTVLMQFGWVGQFFAPPKVFVAMAVFLGFDLLFLAAFAAGEKLNAASDWITAAAIGLPAVTLGFVFYLISVEELAVRPGVIFSFVLGADLCLLALVLLRPLLQPVHVLAGTAVFALLATWTARWLNPGLLNWGLGLYLGFAALHTFFPVVLARQQPGSVTPSWARLFPALSLLVILIPILKMQAVSFVIWPAVLLLDVLAVALAVLTASVESILIAVILTGIATAAWLFNRPPDLTDLPLLLMLIAGFAVFFFTTSLWAQRRIVSRAGDNPDAPLASIFGGASPIARAAETPALSAVLPFVLLIMTSGRLPLENPTPVFGVAMLLVMLLLGLALLTELDVLVPVSLACMLALQYVWHEQHFSTAAAWTPLLWYAAFYVLYTAFPFLFQQKLADRILPWATSALAGPLHFVLFYRVINTAFPNDYMGLLPAVLAVPTLAALMHMERSVPAEAPVRIRLLAWYGASALFFITLIFPIQFERQWITIGWALEGVALIWLFHQVPHPGLRATGVVLLMVAFARLALNPAVLEYHRNSDLRVFNWYLYAYGIVTVCLMFGARLLAKPRHLVWKQNIPPVLYTLGTILAFLLLNIEIANYFAEGPTLTFQFSGSFARDMSYSMAWALFALVMLVVGIWKRLPAPRYAAIGLLSVTLLKLFFHDLSQLGQLYRIGAFLVVAVILIVASFLYQRFVAFEPKNASS
jgi:uncharacterized membrane protein